MKEVVKYVSFDGKEFESAGDCHAYEAAFRYTNRACEEMKEIIFGWLASRGCLKEFLQNAIIFKEFKELCFDSHFIKAAFPWKDTPEGMDFWSQINQDYQKFWMTLQYLKITIKDIEFYIQKKNN